jgi:hypothetical protein
MFRADRQVVDSMKEFGFDSTRVVEQARDALRQRR